MCADRKINEMEVIANLESHLDRLVSEDNFSGAVLVARKDKPFFLKAYGLASLSFNVPNRVDTRFNLGSMNKMFTGVAVVQLAEQGKLSFDDPVVKHLPEYPNKQVAEKVSIHQLLTHTSGMGSHFTEEFMQASKTRFRKVDDYLPLYVDAPLAFEPGEGWQYSNSGFILLGAIIEKISGEDYFDYIREHIYLPAGMLDTDSYDIDIDVPNMAVGYTKMFGSPRRNNFFYHAIKGSPAGGGYSTVEDLLRFANAIQRHELLSQEFTSVLLSGKTKTDRGDQIYAYGFHEEVFSGTYIVGHGGGAPGINSMLDMYLGTDYSVAVMTNYDPPTAERVTSRLRRWLTGTPMPERAHVSGDRLQKYAGKYDPEPHFFPGDIQLKMEKGDLWVSFPMGRRKLIPISETEFCDEETFSYKLFFDLDEIGAVVSLKLAGLGPEIIAKKVT
ncbi:MAG: beta-lactamase family protein [Anaerolineaceae bacterium]|nr:beta-lactamase family protein [Anaerolineaceae bacterium]